MNVDEYQYLHECGVDYVTVFQETYHTDKYETLHLMGHKRVWPYRFDSQERALMGGMRGAGFSALLGLDDFRKDALATALHVYYINRKYPHAELSLSCPRLRPIVNNDKINPRDVGEKELCQVLCAYRIFLPFAGITVSSRESAEFRNGITKICATKVSAGVSTGIGDHEEKYEGKEELQCRRSRRRYCGTGGSLYGGRGRLQCIPARKKGSFGRTFYLYLRPSEQDPYERFSQPLYLPEH